MGDPDLRDGLAGMPSRPEPPRRAMERARAWVTWFGLGRLMLTATCVAVVAMGGFWLVRAPAPPVEATLPVAGDGGTPTSAVPTLPAPGTITSSGMTSSGMTSSSGTSSGSAPATIVVHVAGEVRLPGVYELDGTQRVNDAIERAGGTTVDADLDAVNLAQPLLDGQRLYVPAVGEVDPATIPVLAPDTDVSGTEEGSRGPAASDPVDINRATPEELEALPGVGPSTAAAIVDDRERNGPFATIDDLDRVSGIGPAKLAALADLVTV